MTLADQRKNKPSPALIILFAVYLFVLVYVVLFKYQGETGMRSLNLVPFQWLHEYTNNHVGFKNVFGNIALFVPMGLMLPLLFKKVGPWKAVLCGALVSLSFEVIQYVADIGAADVDDLILNTGGVAIGALVYVLIDRASRDTRKQQKAGFAAVLVFSFAAVAVFLFS